MRVLFLGKIWPEPSSSAAGRRTMEILLSMIDFGWEVHFATAAQHSEYSLDLVGTGIVTSSIGLNDSSFDDWVGELDPDIVIFDRFMTEEQFGWRVEKACPEALRILDTSDLHCLRDGRHRSLKTGEPLDLFNEAALREIASIYRCDLTIMISEYEISVLRESFAIAEDLLTYCPFFADRSAADVPSFDERRDFMMIGSFMHEPNWDAVRWCCSEIWPHIRRALPDAELHVYGSYATDKVYQLNNPKAGILIKGRTDNVAETMTHYRVNLAPLRFGAGLKGKLMDAFAAGLPSVVTPLAKEGMNGTIDWGCDSSGDPREFAEIAATVYQDPVVSDRVRDQGSLIAATRFDRNNWLPLLRGAIEGAVAGKSERRHRNFIGQMLRHHHHRSTEFMSRWIEAKNKRT